MKNYARLFTASMICIVSLFLTVPAFAHFPWINLSNYAPAKGAKIKGTIGWGHLFPYDGFMQQDQLKSLQLAGPQTEAPSLGFSSVLEWETDEGVNAEGGYIIYAERNPGFYTKTTKGGKSVSKQGLEDVISCSYSHKSMKAVANSGAPGDISKPVGLPLEIIPMDNPATLKVGDYLNIQILLDGKPYRGEIYGTYAGFSTDNGTFAYVTSTNKEGYGRIRMLHPGTWLLKTSVETDYSDKNECDKEVFFTSLTFAIQ